MGEKNRGEMNELEGRPYGVPGQYNDDCLHAFKQGLVDEQGYLTEKGRENEAEKRRALREASVATRTTVKTEKPKEKVVPAEEKEPDEDLKNEIIAVLKKHGYRGKFSLRISSAGDGYILKLMRSPKKGAGLMKEVEYVGEPPLLLKSLNEFLSAKSAQN